MHLFTLFGIKKQVKIDSKVSNQSLYFAPKGLFNFTNTVDPDEIMHNVAFHLGLHCL